VEGIRLQQRVAVAGQRLVVGELHHQAVTHGEVAARALHAGRRRPGSGDRRPRRPPQEHRTLDVGTMPSVLRPRKGRFGLVDQEKVFCPDPKARDVFDLRGIDRDAACVVVVRLDQYVTHVLPLDAHQALTDFLAGLLVDAR
jgi:hypothetical protein